LQAALDYVPPTLELVPPPALGTADDESQAVGLSPHEHAGELGFPSQAEPLAAAEPTVPGGMGAAVRNVASSAAAEPSGEVFASAIALEDEHHAAPADLHADEHQPSAEPHSAGDLHIPDDDVPFVAESDGLEVVSHTTEEHAGADHETIRHDPSDNAFLAEETDASHDHFGEDDFHFADEEPAGQEMEGVHFGAAHESPREPGADESHAMGAIATMAAKPPKRKRKVPLAVRLIGIGIFFGIGAVGCYIVAAAFLYFGVADVPEFARGLFPNALVAKSLMQQRTPGKNSQRPQIASQSTTTAQSSNISSANESNPTVADASAESKNAQPAGDKTDEKTNGKPADKQPANDNAAPGPADSDKGATKPNVADTTPPGKADPTTNPFENPKPSDSDAVKDDSSKLDPLAGAAKAPSFDLPDLKGSGKKPDATTNNPRSDNSPGDKTSAGKPDQHPAAAANEQPAESIAPKSDVSFSIKDVAAAMTAVEQSSADLAEAIKANDDSKLKTARVANFRAMSHLASAVTFAKPADAKEADQLAAIKSQMAASLASSAAASAEEREIVGGYARVGVSSKARKESGLFMAGTLKKTEPHGRFFESQLELPGAMAPLVLVTPRKPLAAEGTDVLLLGAVVNDPAKNLPGYDGAAETVIFSDVVVAAPK